MDDLVSRLRAALAAGDNATLLEALLQDPQYRAEIGSRLGEFATVLKGDVVGNWAQQNADRIVSFSSRAARLELSQDAFIVEDGSVRPFHLGYRDVEPSLLAIPDAVVHAGRGMIATQDNSLLWVGAPWAMPGDYLTRAYGAIVANPASGEVLLRRYPEPKQRIPEAAWIAFGSKYFGASLISLMGVALLPEVIGTAKVPMVTATKFMPRKFELEAFARIGLGHMEILDLEEAPTTLVEKLWVPYVPIQFGAAPKNCAIAMDVMRRRLGVGTRPVPGGSEVVYISRADASRRRVTTEERIVEALQRFGVRSVTFSELSVDERIEVFKSAKVIVGPVGSNLSNPVFAPDGAWVLEFMPRFYDVDLAVREQIGNFMASMGHRYIRLPCEVEQVEGEKYTQWDMTVAPEDVVTAVEFALSHANAA